MVGLRTNGFVGFILIGKVLENGINAFTYYVVNISDLVNVVHHRIDFRQKNKTQTAFQMPKTTAKRQRENHFKNLTTTFALPLFLFGFCEKLQP